MKVDVVIERSSKGRFSAYMEYYEDLDFGLNGQGDSVENAISDFLGAYSDMQEYYQEINKEIPDLDFNYKYDVASFLAYYSGKLTLAGLERITGVNQAQLGHYLTGHRKPSKRTAERIEKALHAFGEDIRQIHFV